MVTTTVNGSALAHSSSRPLTGVHGVEGEPPRPYIGEEFAFAINLNAPF
jgi:hypothetical protein